MTSLGVFGTHNASLNDPRFIIREGGSKIAKSHGREREKGKETSSKMVFENISIEFQSLKSYRRQNSEAK